MPKFLLSLLSLLVLGQTLFPIHTYAVSNQGIIQLTNAERQAVGLPALAWNGALGTSALLKAQDMCNKDYWSHVAPDGATGWLFMAQAGYPYVAAGENLAKNFTTDSGVVSGWMASPTHRANILSGSYAEIGVASLDCELLGQITTVVVAHYGSRGVVSAPAPAPAPAPKPAPTPQTAPKPVQATATPQAEAPTQTQPVVEAKEEPKPIVHEQLWIKLANHSLELFDVKKHDIFALSRD